MKYDFYSLYPPADLHIPFLSYTHTHTTSAPEEVCFGVAEMKFKPLPEMTELLAKAAYNGFLGYVSPTEEFTQVVADWQRTRRSWNVSPDWFFPVSGVIPTMGLAIRTFTRPGDKIIVQPPVYPPFYVNIEGNGRVIERNPLLLKGDRWEINLEELEALAEKPDVTALILCSPHNPIGRVWTYDELTEIARIARENHLFVISDEIHSDLIMPGHTHTVFSKVAPDVRHIVLNAPSKTFSIPGLGCALAFAPDDTVRASLRAAVELNGGYYSNALGLLACGAGYRWGAQWVDEVCAVIDRNDTVLREALAEYLPSVRMAKAQGTYLRWADLSGLNLPEEKLKAAFQKAHFHVQRGNVFVRTDTQYVRLNVACPEQYIRPAIQRFYNALQTL